MRGGDEGAPGTGSWGFVRGGWGGRWVLEGLGLFGGGELAAGEEEFDVVVFEVEGAVGG